MLKTTSRRLRLATIVGAVLAIGSLVAVPTAASAAEVQNCVTGTTPTPETEPWQTFVDGGNGFEGLSTAFAELEDGVNAALLPLGPLSTQADLDAAAAGVTAAVTSVSGSFSSTELTDSITALSAGLLAADPANEATWTATLTAIFDKLDADSTAIDFNGAFETYITSVSDYLDSVQDALDALPPTAPGTAPQAITVAGVALTAVIIQLADLAQVDLYDAAAAQVVFAQVCTTTTVADVAADPTVPAAPTLANTGSSDGPMLGAVAALLLLVGAGASVLVARRRRAL
jgi:LPXTG-motif cell wall-anchored protein